MLTGLALAGPFCLFGGSFSSDFSSVPTGATAYGNASVDTGSGVLVLTPAANSQLGSFIIDDLDPGQRIASFTASFKLLMGGGTTPPADGVSFNFAPDLPNAAFNEEGGGSGLTITFDAYDNGTGDAPEGPEFRVKFKNALVASRKVTNQFRTGSGFADVTITYTSAGTINLVYGGAVMFTNLSVGGALGTGSRFGFGARTGGLNQNQFIDDLSISTTPLTRFYVKGAAVPTPALGASPDTPFQVSLQDAGTAVNPNSVSLVFDGLAIATSVSKSAGVTTIFYDPPGWLLSNSLNRATVTFADSAGPGNVLQYDFSAASGPIWSLAPGSRPYITTDASSTPNQRSIAYNAVSNHLYIVSRTGTTTGLTINALDPVTGAFLYQLNTAGISGGSIILLCIGVADDGAIYAANEVATANAVSNPLKIYRWPDAGNSTAPILVYSGDPGSPTGGRWGDTLAVRGAGTNTQIILDATNSQVAAILTATDSSLTSFIPSVYSHGYIGNVVGRSLQFGPTNTFLLKKKSSATPPVAMPLELIRYDTAPSTTVLFTMGDFHPQLGPVALDLSRGLAAGIFFSTNASPTTAPADRLVVFDISNLASPFQVASYSFPTNHQANANFIGQVVFGGDRIFALEGNNGLIAVPAILPTMPFLKETHSGPNVRLSWSNSVYPFQLQAAPAIVGQPWTNVGLPVTTIGGENSVTDNVAGAARFYRLFRP